MAAPTLDYQSGLQSGATPKETVRPILWICLGIVVVSGLWAVVVPKLDSGRGGEAKLAAAQNDVASLHGAIVAYQSDLGRLPTANEGFDVLVQRPADGNPNWHGPYLQETPSDPWGRPYVYVKPGAGGSAGFNVLSYGPDGKPGGGDDISD